MPTDSTEIAILRTKVEGLREMMETNFQHMQKQLQGLTNSLEKLAGTTVTLDHFKQHVQDTNKRDIHLNNHQKRITALEQTYRILKVLGGIAVSVLIAVLVALATGKATIVWH